MLRVRGSRRFEHDLSAGRRRFVGAFAEDTKAMVVRCNLPSQLVVDLAVGMFVNAAGEEVLLWLSRIGAWLIPVPGNSHADSTPAVRKQRDSCRPVEND